MARVRANIIINGRPYWALFDTGSRNTYIISEVSEGLVKQNLKQPINVALGGGTFKIHQACILEAFIEDLRIVTQAFIMPSEIGFDEKGKRIEVLFGALAMEQWGIRPLPDEERIDISCYPKEFVEF